MTERPPATDLRRRDTSEDSFAGSMANTAAVCAVDSLSDLLLDAAPKSAV